MARRPSLPLLFARDARHAFGVATARVPRRRPSSPSLSAPFCSHSAWRCSRAPPSHKPPARRTIPQRRAAQPKMLIQADELVNNKDKNTITAEGHARIYYKGRVLQADRVVYDRNTNRVYAEGHAR